MRGSKEKTVELKPIGSDDIEKRRNLLKKNGDEFFGVFDIETNRWVNFRMAAFYDGEIFKHFTCLEDMCAHIFSYNKSFKVYAHFGGGFDFLFLLQSIFSGDTYEVHKIIPRGDGSILLFFQVHDKRNPKVKITFVDSNAALPYKLADLCAKFDPKNKKDANFDSAMIDEVTPEVIEYCKMDCISLWEIIDKFRKSPLIEPTGMKLTVASQAMATFQTFLKDPIQSLYFLTSSDRFKAPLQQEKANAYRFRYDWWIRGHRCAPIVVNDKVEHTKIEPAYFGGRTEVFTPHFLAPPSLYYYDFNSMYPAVMRDNEFPHQVTEHYTATVKKPLKFMPDWMGFWDVDVFVPKMFAPPLGIIHRGKASGKFIFPTGTFRGKWATPELEYALSIGCKIVKVHECLRMNSCGHIFKDFVQTLYDIRLNSKDEIDKTNAKLILNSCYGRFGLNPERESIELDSFFEGTKPIKLGENFLKLVDTENKILEFCTTTTLSNTFSNVAIAAYVTCYARIALHKALAACGEDLYYCDTDSFFTTRKLPVSMNLGDIKQEKEMLSAAFILPKAYAAVAVETSETGEVSHRLHVKLKGLDQRKTGNFTPEQMMDQFRGSYELEKARKRMAAKDELEQIKKMIQTISTETYDETHFAADVAAYKADPAAFLLKNNGLEPHKQGKGVHKMTKSTLLSFGKFVVRKPVLTRRIQSAYDKRRVYVKPDGSFATEAWELRNGAIINEGIADSEPPSIASAHGRQKRSFGA